MSSSNDITNALPRRHPKEPRELRQDIADEIADHMHEATQRELQRGAEDETAAYERAIETFGNPKAVARRLWWDAMKETVMREWIQTGIMGVMALSLFAMLAFVYVESQNTRAVVQQQTAMLESLRASFPPGDYRTVELRATRGSTDGPAAKMKVEIHGRLITADHDMTVTGTTDANGLYLTQAIRIGEHELRLRDEESGFFKYTKLQLAPGVDVLRERIVAPRIVEMSPLQPRIVCKPELWDHVACFEVYYGINADDRWSFSKRFLVAQKGVATDAQWETSILQKRVATTGLVQYRLNTFDPALDAVTWGTEMPFPATRSISFLGVIPIDANGYAPANQEFVLQSPNIEAGTNEVYEIHIPDETADSWIAQLKELRVESEAGDSTATPNGA